MDSKETVTEKLIPSLIAGLTVLVIFYFFAQSGPGSELLFAALGSSAFLICAFPDIRTAKLRNVLMGYFYGGVFGLSSAYLLQYSIPVYLSAFMAVFLTSFFMLISRGSHPPAVGAALAFVIYRRTTLELFVLYIAILILMIVAKFLVYVYRKEMHIGEFKHEFLK